MEARLTRRGFIRLSLMGATGAIVAACTPSAPAPTEAPQGQQPTAGPAATEIPTVQPAPAEPVTLNYVYVADPGEAEIRQACIDDFMKKNPSIKIDGQLLPEDGLDQKILTQLAGGAAPDVVYFNANVVPTYASQGAFVPVDDYAAKDTSFAPDDFFPGILDNLTYKGKVYGYPYYSGPGFITYNKTLFEKLGVPLPTAYTEGYEDGNDTWTWDNMLVLAQQLTQGEGAEKTFGYTVDNSLSVGRRTWLPGYGAMPYDEALTKCMLTEPAAIEAIKFQVELITKYKVAPNASELEGLPDGFLSGRIAMARGIRASVPGYKDAPFEIGEAPVPKGPKGRFTFDGPNAVGIISTCKNKDAAWTFVSYLPGNKPGELGGQEFEFKASRSIPTRKSNFQSPVFSDNLLKWEDAAVYQNAAEHVINPPRPGRWPEVSAAFAEQWDAMVLGKPVDQAMADACAAIEPLLKEG